MDLHDIEFWAGVFPVVLPTTMEAASYRNLVDGGCGNSAVSCKMTQPLALVTKFARTGMITVAFVTNW